MATKFVRHPKSGKVSEIVTVIPEHLEIKGDDNYKGLFTKKAFKKGEVVYIDNAFKFACEDIEENFTLKTHKGNFNCNIDVHPVSILDGKKIVFGIDSFVNHKCDNNVISFVLEETETDYSFNMVALRDIKEDEQITINYNEYYYDNINFECNCGSSDCCGAVRGFRYLSKEKRKKRISAHNCEYLTKCLEMEGEEQYKL